MESGLESKHTYNDNVLFLWHVHARLLQPQLEVVELGASLSVMP